MTHTTQIKKRAILATAAAAKLCTTSFSSTAAIVYTDLNDEFVSQSTFFIDLDGAGDDLSFTHEMAEHTNYEEAGNEDIYNGSASIDSDDTTFSLAESGDVFNASARTSLTFASASIKIQPFRGGNMQVTDGPFENGGSGYLGFTLGSGNHGWLAFSIAPFEEGDLDSYAITLKDYAYEDSGEAIIVGVKTNDPKPNIDVPEPASWALFALGAYFVSRRKGKVV